MKLHTIIGYMLFFGLGTPSIMATQERVRAAAEAPPVPGPLRLVEEIIIAQLRHHDIHLNRNQIVGVAYVPGGILALRGRRYIWWMFDV